MIAYTLTTDDKEEIAAIVKQRQSDKRQKGIRNKYHDKYSQGKTEEMGLKGELAWARLTGLPLDTTLRDGGDKGVDFSTWFGPVDVKTSTTPYLIFDSLEDVRADAIIAARTKPDNDTVFFVGWCTRKEFLEWHTTKDFGYGTRYVVPHDRLPDCTDILYYSRHRTP